jgi:hypothetical protein
MVVDDHVGDEGDTRSGGEGPTRPDEPSTAPRPSTAIWARIDPRRGIRPAAAVLAFVVGCALATGGLTAWVAGRGGQVAVPASTSSSVEAAVADPSESLARVAALQPLLDRRAAAVRTGRRADWAATLDPLPARAAFREAQLAEFDRLRQLPVRAWRYETLQITASGGGPGGGDAFTARVRLTYRLLGDTRDVVRPFDLDVARRGANWVFTGVHRRSREADPWELGRLTVLTGRRSIVIGVGRTPAGPALGRVASDVDAAAARVDGVWGTAWRRTVVVIVPPDLSGMADLLGRRASADPGNADPGNAGLDQVAAVTSGELSGDRAVDGGSADRVVLNPSAFGRLSPLGRRVVLTHELTHVATRATARASVPLWVDEGFANYVAYSGSGLAPGVIAADVLPSVRAGTAQERLPTADAFDPGHGRIAPAYADAWLAFDLMARDGPRRPLEFYRVAVGLPATTGEGAAAATRVPGTTTATVGGVAEAFRRVLGTDQSAFEARWRAYRRSLAGTGGR